jgi:glycosyltransferase involved in cell wall biosynthesis
MKLLIIPFVPPSEENGGNISQLAILDKLRYSINISLVYIIRNDYDFFYFTKLDKEWQNVRLIPIDLRYKSPEPKKNLFSINVSRIRNVKNRVINFFKPQKPSNPILENVLDNYLLSRIGPGCLEKNLINQISKVIKSEDANIVQIEFFEFLPLINLCDNTKTVFVHHELRFQVIKDLVKSNSMTDDFYTEYVQRMVTQHEFSYLLKYEKIMVFSELDRLRLEDFSLPKNKIAVIPFPVADTIVQNRKMLTWQNETISALYFLGAEDHLPNKNALLWFLDHVFEELTQSLDLKLKIIGRWSNETITACENRFGSKVVFMGFVKDLPAAFDEKGILLNTVYEGSGIRTKLLYAFAMGVPAISTTKGCEGIPVSDGVHLLIANDKAMFISQIKKLFQHNALFELLQSNAYELINAFYTPEAIIEQRLNLYKSIDSSKHFIQ